MLSLKCSASHVVTINGVDKGCRRVLAVIRCNNAFWEDHDNHATSDICRLICRNFSLEKSYLKKWETRCF